MFGLVLVQGEWKVYVSGLLDREQQDWYLLNITASDGLYVARTAVEVTVMDANDNSPICNQVRDKKIWKWVKIKRQRNKRKCKGNKHRAECCFFFIHCFSICLHRLFVSRLTTFKLVFFVYIII